MMKKFHIILLTAAVAFAACEKDPPGPGPSEKGLEQVSVNIANLSGVAGGLDVNWQTGDQVKFIGIKSSDRTIATATPSIYTITSGAGTKNGVFGYASGTKITPDEECYFMYRGNMTPVLNNNREIKFDLPTTQTQASGTDFSHIEKESFFYNNLSTPGQDYSGFTFRQSVLELELSSGAPVTGKIAKLTVIAQTDCFVSSVAVRTSATTQNVITTKTNQLELAFTDKPSIPTTAKLLVYWNTSLTSHQGSITVTAELENGDMLASSFAPGDAWTAGKTYKKSVVLAPIPTGSYEDAEMVVLQEHTAGNGIPVVIMGDGYTAAQMARGSGKYEKDMKEAMESFFCCYPISDLREYFDVYMVAAISAEEGMSVTAPSSSKNTAFKTVWAGSGSTSISCNYNTVFNYIRRAGITSASDNEMPLYPISVIMPINYNTYAGTCMFWTSKHAMSIGMIPVNTNAVGSGRSFRETVVHECAGHGFAKVSDEYIYYQTSTFPAENIAAINTYKQRGCYDNIDFTSAAASTSWGKFVTNYAAKYPMVSTYEGAMMYGKGIYRPESNSCMNNNVLYFNAPSRYAQVRNVMEISQVESDFTINDFVAWETTVPTPLAQPMRSSPEQFQPLGEPIVFDLPQGANISTPKRVR